MQTARAPPKAGVSAKRISSSFRDCNNYSIEMVLRKHNFVPIRVSCRRLLSSSALRRDPWAADEPCVSCRRLLSSSALRRDPWAADEPCVSCRRLLSSSALRRDPWAADEPCVSCRRLLSSSALRRDLGLQTSPVSLLQTIAFFVRAAAGPWAADESCVSLADCRRAVGTWGTHYVPLCTATCEAQAEACLQERYRGSAKQPKVPPQPLPGSTSARETQGLGTAA